MDNGKPDVKDQIQKSVTDVEEHGKDKAESGKPIPNRILRYAEV